MALKVLQLACFQGNIGDNANIVGTRAQLAKNFDEELSFTDVDILDFSWGRRNFDKSFIEQVNEHDLAILGGGGFFELTCPESSSGTPLDLSEEILSQIETPTVFYALGVDVGRGVDPVVASRFQSFLETLLSQDQFLVSVRNDGAIRAVETVCGREVADQIDVIPDGGIFTEIVDWKHPEIPEGSEVIGINLAGDMPSVRFPGKAEVEEASASSALSRLLGRSTAAPVAVDPYEEFLLEFAQTLIDVLSSNPKLHLVFVPHIFKDIGTIERILKTLTRLDHSICRRRVSVAPYAIGDNAQSYCFDLYAKCRLVMGMRFHSNVCPIGLGVPTIGLVSYHQIEKYYVELGIPERLVTVNQPGFRDALNALMLESLASPDPVREKYASIRESAERRLKEFHSKIQAWAKI